MKSEIQREINKTLAAFSQLFSLFDQDRVNIIPFEGSWTAGQLIQHLIMSNSGFVKLINGEVKETNRKPDEYVEKIKTAFLDFTTKMQSPDFIRPPMMNYNKVELMQSLQSLSEEMNQSIEKLDLTKTCISFELPVFGHLTRWEAIHFVLYHTQRHIHQLKKIFQIVVERNKVLHP